MFEESLLCLTADFLDDRQKFVKKSGSWAAVLGSDGPVADGTGLINNVFKRGVVSNTS